MHKRPRTRAGPAADLAPPRAATAGARGLRHLGRGGALGGAALAHPLHRAGQALLERHRRLEAEQVRAPSWCRGCGTRTSWYLPPIRSNGSSVARSGPGMPSASWTLSASFTIEIGSSAPMLMISPEVSGRSSARTKPSTVSLT